MIWISLGIFLLVPGLVSKDLTRSSVVLFSYYGSASLDASVLLLLPPNDPRLLSMV
jgi:hypothetical protein